MNTSHGVLGPVCEHGSFRYIPIPERDPSPRSWTYARLGLARWLPEDWSFQYAHYDPEFETYTWGDYPNIRTFWTRQLDPGEHVFFIASLRSVNASGSWSYSVVGYFTLDGSPVEVSFPVTEAVAERFHNNAHIRRGKGRKPFIIFSGRSDNSRLLEKAVPISYGKLPNELAKRVFSKLNPESPRWWQGTVQPQAVEELFEAIRDANQRGRRQLACECLL